MAEKKNYYELIGVPEDSDEETIRLAVKASLKQNHPDHGGSVEVCQEILQAKWTLLSARRRRVFDEELRQTRQEVKARETRKKIEVQKSSERFEDEFQEVISLHRKKKIIQAALIGSGIAAVIIIAVILIANSDRVRAALSPLQTTMNSVASNVTPSDARQETSSPAATPAPAEVDIPEVSQWYAEPGNSTPQTLMVAADGSEEFISINKAIASASSIDTIRVKPGEYRERIVLKEGVRVIGQDKGACRVIAPDGGVPVMTASGLSTGFVENLNLVGDGHDVIGLLIEDSTIEVRNCSFDGLRTGIEVAGAAAKPTIVDCTVINSTGDGVIFKSESGGETTRSMIAKNSGSGIKTVPRIHENTVIENGIHGIVFDEGAGGISEANEIRQNGGSGILVSASVTAPLIVDNEILRNNSHGIYFQLRSSGMARGNNIHGNKESGVFISEPGTFPTLRDNYCHDNEMDGGSTVAMLNVCENNGVAGIAVVGERTSVTLAANRCANNKFNGIEFSNGATGFAKGNECSDNLHAGISVTDKGTDPTLINNHCKGNRVSGISFLRGASGKAYDNVLELNIWTGIGVLGIGTIPEVGKNAMLGNGEWPVYYGRR